MNVQVTYDQRYTLSPEILRLLELSQAEVAEMESWDLRCPICGFRIHGVYADRAGHVDIKHRTKPD